MSEILQSIHVEAEFSQKGKQKKKCRQIKGSKDPDTNRDTFQNKLDKNFQQIHMDFSPLEHNFFEHIYI